MKVLIVKASELGTNWLWPLEKLRAEIRLESPEYKQKLRPRRIKLVDVDWDQLEQLADSAGVEPGALVAAWIAKETSP